MAKGAKPITQANGNPINAVLILIARLSHWCMKYQNNEDLGAFFRALAINLSSGNPDNSEAGEFARELLTAAKVRLDQKAAAGRAGMASRWNHKGGDNGEK